MTQTPKNAFALTAVIQGVLPEGFRHRVARRCRHHRDAEVGPNSLAVGSRALPPLRRSFICLIDASGDRGPHDWIGTEGIEEVVPELDFLRWPPVGQVHLWARRDGRGRIDVARGRSCVCDRLRLRRGSERSHACEGNQQRDNSEPLNVHVKFSLPGISTLPLGMAVATSQRGTQIPNSTNSTSGLELSVPNGTQLPTNFLFPVMTQNGGLQPGDKHVRKGTHIRA